MQENNFINVNTFMKKRVMMISSNKLISTEIKMKTFNEATITELRNDLKNAIKAIEEKHGIAISLGTAKFNDERLYFSKFTCVINSSKNTNRMYAKPEDVEEYLNNSPKKPYILCEFMHDMGNSMGGLGSYMKLIDKYDRYHGGFIWDFIDQAIMVKDPVTGKDVLRYGGDFDDKPADYEFSANGIVFADRKEKPAMQEVRYYYGLYR